jgi:hypothetical protein
VAHGECRGLTITAVFHESLHLAVPRGHGDMVTDPAGPSIGHSTHSPVGGNG